MAMNGGAECLNKQREIARPHRGKPAPQAEAPCAGVPDRLVEEYREAPVTHAHETGWRTNGNNGDTWLFASPSSACSA
jgi:hypothetical protein